ncbi:MAG: MBOAT family protein [Planctomycetes bacterium]|nr:MBOAT family protein [Planctomycetota bacterium]
MHFHTWTFLPFFLIAYAVYLGVKATRFGNLWIVIVSYVFYGWWNPLYLALISYSTLVDYGVLACMEKSPRKKLWVSVSLANGLLLLSVLKYGVFITDNINHVLTQVGSPYAIAAPGYLLPLGLSFYVFKSMGYVIDCYRGDVARETNLIRHAAFVSFFPILLAGPIERAAHLLPQFRDPRRVTGQDMANGLSLFVKGLFKKVALADCLALYVNPIYNSPEDYQGPALILATVAFAWQIYFDFSGYTDMARGVARAMGFRIMLNFDHPYLATGLGDFWRRWHISLSTWFRDYVYIPLGGSRRGPLVTTRNVCLTLVISGLWHGAAWTFVIWGALHALGLIVTRALERHDVYRNKCPRLVKQMGVFAFVTFAWIFFRANSWHDACLIVTRLVTSGLSDPKCPLLFVALIGVVWIYQYLCESSVRQTLASGLMRVSMVVFMLLYLTLFSSAGGQAFIYNQF